MLGVENSEICISMALRRPPQKRALSRVVEIERKCIDLNGAVGKPTLHRGACAWWASG